MFGEEMGGCCALCIFIEYFLNTEITPSIFCGFSALLIFMKSSSIFSVNFSTANANIIVSLVGSVLLLFVSFLICLTRFS